MKSFRIYLERHNYHNLLERRFEWFNSMKDLIINLRKSFPEESLYWSSSEEVGKIYDVFGVKLQIIKHNIFYNIFIVKNLSTGKFAKLRVSELKQLGQ